jgi:phosphatidylserine decarboxylase
VAELLGDDDAAARFDGGTFVTLYLAPRHYHRIHAPIGGRLPWARHIPGRLLPVSAPAVRGVNRLFPRNERLVVLLEPEPATAGTGGAAGPAGAAAVVAVGAFNVGRITADFDPELVTNRRGARSETRRYPEPLRVARGEPLMAFHLGSTVVLLLERAVALAPGLVPGSEVRVGAALTGAYSRSPRYH